MSNLQEEIERRKQEARDKKISSKARYVASFLGKHRSLNDNKGTEGVAYNFECDGLKITYQIGSGSSSDGHYGFYGLEIFFEGKKVFKEGGGTLYSFIPGRWEGILEDFLPETKRVAAETTRKEEQEKAAKKKAEEDQERAKWGL